MGVEEKQNKRRDNGWERNKRDEWIGFMAEKEGSTMTGENQPLLRKETYHTRLSRKSSLLFRKIGNNDHPVKSQDILPDFEQD